MSNKSRGGKKDFDGGDAPKKGFKKTGFDRTKMVVESAAEIEIANAIENEERAQRRQERLDNINELRIAAGQAPLTSLDSDDEDGSEDESESEEEVVDKKKDKKKSKDDVAASSDSAMATVFKKVTIKEGGNEVSTKSKNAAVKEAQAAEDAKKAADADAEYMERQRQRLEIIKRQREEAEAKKKADSAAAALAAQQEADERAKALIEDADAAKEGPPKLTNIEMKGMKPDALKEALEARGLSKQGNAKELLKRLMDYETARK